MFKHFQDHPGAYEEPLQGGNQTDDVVRIGDTVRRPNQPWSPAIRALLDHLETVSPGIAPESLGLDQKGRDTISFVEGETGHYPLSASMRTDVSLIRTARLLRRYHDATADLADRIDLPWANADPDPARREVICHNDVAPYNIIFQDGSPAVLFDFDHAGPGPRIRDLAYAVYRFAPLASNESCRHFGWETPPDRDERMLRFVDAYGPTSIDGLIPMVEQRIRDLRDNIAALAQSNPERVRVHLAEDHVGSYNRDLAWITANRSELQDALKAAGSS